MLELAPALREVIGECLRGKSPWPLLLHGPCGTGKTCAALLITDHVRRSLYWTVEDLMQVAFEPEAAVWYYASQAPLVVVDELAVRATDTDREYAAVARMADLREHRPSLWISNHRPEVLREAYDARVYSRLTCGTVVALNGRDRRRG